MAPIALLAACHAVAGSGVLQAAASRRRFDLVLTAALLHTAAATADSWADSVQGVMTASDAAHGTRPLSCGALVFLHIGKTGGTSIVDHLRQQAAAGGFEKFDVKRPEDPDRHKDPDWGNTYNYTEDPDWQAFLRRAHHEKRPRLVLQLHHGVPGVGCYLWEHELRPLRHVLEGKQCELRLTTVLRNPSDRLQSEINYKLQRQQPEERNVTDEQLCQSAHWESNVQTETILSGHPLAEGNIWRTSGTINRQDCNTTDGSPAIETLQELFDTVGCTEQLDSYAASLDMILGASRRPLVHQNPSTFHANFSARALECVRDSTQADKALYDTFCPQG